MQENRFNKWFNAFILIGMTVALVLTTAFRIGSAGDGRTLLLVSAFGSLMGVLATVCSANGHIITFLFGLLDVTIYGAMCFINWRHGNPGLGNAILHAVYFIPMQFIGFFQWRNRGAGSAEKLKARRLGGRKAAGLTALFLAGSAAAYFILARFDKSAADGFIRVAVVLDVIPLMCNIIGQLLMSTAYMEQWIFWIGVNISSILMWSASMGSSDDSFAIIYIIKYSFYLLNSFNGLRIWIQLSRPEKERDIADIG